MIYRARIAAWFVASSFVLIVIMLVSTYFQIEEELREGRVDPTHPSYKEWALHNSYREEEIEEIMGELIRTWFRVGLPVLAFTIGGGLLLARRSLRPVSEVNRQLASMNPEELSGDIRIHEDDRAFRDLARHLNSLLDRAGAAYRQQAEFSAKVAHEIRTPLMLLRSRIEKESSGIPVATQEELQDELARLSRFVESALLAAKAESGTLAPAIDQVDVTTLLRDLGEGYALLARERGLDFSLRVPDHLKAATDADLLLRSLHSLLENAIRYAKSMVHIHADEAAGDIRIHIENDCDPQMMAVPGLGFGLRLVRSISRVTGTGFHTSHPSGKFSATLSIKTTP